MGMNKLGDALKETELGSRWTEGMQKTGPNMVLKFLSQETAEIVSEVETYICSAEIISSRAVFLE